MKASLQPPCVFCSSFAVWKLVRTWTCERVTRQNQVDVSVKIVPAGEAKAPAKILPLQPFQAGIKDLNLFPFFFFLFFCSKQDQNQTPNWLCQEEKQKKKSLTELLISK